ncbi:MAG TPA: hypothetical protein RMH99_08215 [Sandaracinaceae bacterium LLY-WYZ-13_1]|nr:hypothetical protein [Sandaracinaceae bacterium LLY-WYZ-13_1]
MSDFEREPERRVDDPERLADDPERLADDPERLADDPERLVDDPERLVDDPERLVDDPERLVDDPERLADDPELGEIFRSAAEDDDPRALGRVAQGLAATIGPLDGGPSGASEPPAPGAGGAGAGLSAAKITVVVGLCVGAAVAAWSGASDQASPETPTAASERRAATSTSGSGRDEAPGGDARDGEPATVGDRAAAPGTNDPANDDGGASGPNVNGLDANGSDGADRGRAIDPDAIGHDAIDPDAVDPDAVDPDAIDPDAIDPGAAPGAGDDGAGAPGAAGSNAFAEELALVQRIRRALADDPRDALRLAAEHERRFDDGQLVVERERLRARARAALEDREADAPEEPRP